MRPLSRERGEKQVLPSLKLEIQTVDIGANQSTGEQRYAQCTGIRVHGKFITPNAGFNANQGATFLQRTARLAIEKAKNVQPELARVAVKEMMSQEKFRNSLTLTQLAWVAQLLGFS